MVQKLEAIKGGGGSIRIGTVGTIGSLMTRELESSNLASFASSSSSPNPVSRPHGNAALKTRTSTDEASCSSDKSTKVKHKSLETVQRSQNQPRVSITSTTPKRQKQKTPLEDLGNNNGNIQGKGRNQKRSSRIPMLGAENIQLQKTPIREKPGRKGNNTVDVVDVNCGNRGSSLSNRLKKLGFSKLSHSFM